MALQKVRDILVKVVDGKEIKRKRLNAALDSLDVKFVQLKELPQLELKTTGDPDTIDTKVRCAQSPRLSSPGRRMCVDAGHQEAKMGGPIHNAYRS